MTDIELIQDFSLNYVRLDGKVAIVTGANKGLGMGYAVALAKAGADIYLPYRSGDIEEVKALIEAEGRRVEFIQGDLTDMEHIHAIVDGCMAAYGKIDILWLDAGWVRKGDGDDFGQDIRLNEIVDRIRKFQPWLICADRTVGGPYENYVTPELCIPTSTS